MVKLQHLVAQSVLEYTVHQKTKPGQHPAAAQPTVQRMRFLPLLKSSWGLLASANKL